MLYDNIIALNEAFWHQQEENKSQSRSEAACLTVQGSFKGNAVEIPSP